MSYNVYCINIIVGVHNTEYLVEDTSTQSMSSYNNSPSFLPSFSQLNSKTKRPSVVIRKPTSTTNLRISEMVDEFSHAEEKSPSEHSIGSVNESQSVKSTFEIGESEEGNMYISLSIYKDICIHLDICCHMYLCMCVDMLDSKRLHGRNSSKNGANRIDSASPSSRQESKGSVNTTNTVVGVPTKGRLTVSNY
jgi:hypothetical protein